MVIGLGDTPEHPKALKIASSSAAVRKGAVDEFAEVSEIARGISADKPEAAEHLRKRYQDFSKRLQVDVGTLLKLDNVSFLLAAGCSREMGGVTFGSIPHVIERGLLDEGHREGGEPDGWLRLFYVAAQAFARRHDDARSESTKRFLTALAESPIDIARRHAELTPDQIPVDRGDSIGGDELHKYVLPVNFEQFLSTLYGWDATLQSGAQDVVLQDGTTVDTAQLTELIRRLKRSLVDACSLPKGDRIPKTHQMLLLKLMTRPENLRRVKLFTLNYDTLLERAADSAGTILVDGFVGAIHRVFHPESFEFDFYFPGSTTEGRVHRLDRVAHLYKLHGSVNWYREEPSEQNPFGIYCDAANATGSDALIFPTPVKQELATGIPYSEMFRRFSHAICQPQSVLFTIGYGFGDDHVNALIRQALLVPSFRLVVVSPSVENDFAKRLIDCRDPRVWVISGRPERVPGTEGLIGFGTFEAFVRNALPDLQDERVRQDIARTFRALDQKPGKEDGHG